MSLPKLDVPIYTLKLPSSGKKISYRPFLVKEEKILLMAVEGEDESEVINAIKQIINNCVITKGINPENLALFDIEYILLNLRSKSMGDVIKTTYVHKECKPVELEIDVNTVEVTKPKDHTNIIELTDTIGLVMKYPDITMMDMISPDGLNNQKTDDVFDLITRCVDKVYDKEETYSKTDYTPEEIKEWIYGLTPDQFAKVEHFFETLPKMSKKVEFNCPCGYTEEILLEGLTSFFG